MNEGTDRTDGVARRAAVLVLRGLVHVEWWLLVLLLIPAAVLLVCVVLPLDELLTKLERKGGSHE